VSIRHAEYMASQFQRAAGAELLVTSPAPGLCSAAHRRQPSLNPEGGPRPDQVRHAFNTPFWPMVLTTTSVGQEGLDFHLWCRSIAHWDLARTPVELEQREGRVARYSSLSIRRALAADPRFSNFTPAVSVWEEIARQASGGAADASQMSPWWRTEGAATQQFYLYAQGSREAHQRRRLERARALYRMVFGASDPAALLEELEANDAVTEEMAREASLCLSAWEQRGLDEQNVRQLRKRLRNEGLWVRGSTPMAADPKHTQRIAE